MSPGFTELDEVQDEELRNRAWRDFITSARSAGDRDMLDLLETGVRPNDLDSAFAIICGNEDVEFPPGDGVCPDPKPAWKALEKFWKKLEKQLPDTLDDGTTCKIQKAAREFRAQLRVARKKLDRPSTIADLLETWDCESKITQNRWADTTAEKKRFKDVDRATARDFRAATVTPYLSQWRQYVYRLSVTLLTRARDHAPTERRRRNSLNYGDLLNLTAKVLRENAQVRRALQQKYRHLFVDEFQDTDPVQAEIVLSARGGSMSPVAVRLQPALSARLAHGPAPSRRALRRRRPQAVDLPFPPRGHRDLQHRSRALQRPIRRARRAADDELPVGAGAVRVGERRVRGAVSDRADVALAAIRAARSRESTTSKKSSRRLSSRLTHTCDEAKEVRRSTPRPSRATSGPRSMPAGASTATS